MPHVRVFAAFAVLALLAPARTQGGGDEVLENIPVPTTAQESFSTADVVTTAKTIDPANGAEVEQAINDGNLGIVEFHDPGNFGFHDYNTIGLNPDFGVLVMAVAILHEWWHVERCGGGPSNGGTTNYSPPQDPCGACQHVQATSNSWTQLSEALCNPPCPTPFPLEACRAREDLKSIAKEQFSRCGNSSCPSKPTWTSLANWTKECFCCTL
jgi:hypothetical protein